MHVFSLPVTINKLNRILLYVDLEKIKLNQAQEKVDPVKQIQCSGDGHYCCLLSITNTVWDAICTAIRLCLSHQQKVSF